MEKSKKLIIIMMVVVILIIIIVTILLKISQKEIQDENDNPETSSFSNIEKVNNKTLFHKINYNINNYYNYIKQQNTEGIKSISQNGATIKDENSKFYSQEMYVLDKISNITVYVYGVTRQKEKENSYYLIMNIDYLNNTFLIQASTKEEFDNAKNNKIDSKYRENININKNQYNAIQEKNITDFEILDYYFEDYKYKALYKQEEAFKLIENQYKQEKFKNDINKYKEYINNNISRFKDANIVRHGTTKNGEYLTFIAYDNYNNYYKITENGINEYTVILDNYTQQTDEILEQYNNLPQKQKVTSNVDKIIKWINEKNYEELYNHINDNFKNQHFKTQEEFEKYIKTKFFDNNIVGAVKIQTEGDIYIVTVPYKESLSTAAEEGEVTLYIKLGEKMNFEVSFNM